MKILKLKFKEIKLYCCLFILFFSLPIVVSAWYSYDIKLSGWDLVDSEKHLDWDVSTSHMNTWNSTISKWEGYIYGVIRKDTWNTINDLTILESNNGANGIAGRTTQNNNLTNSENLSSKYIDKDTK